MIPRMRPSSTRRSMPSSAMVVPNALRRPRASMDAIASSLLFFAFRLWPWVCASLEQFFRCQTEPLNRCEDPRPLLFEKLRALALHQQIARAGFDEHAETALHLDELLVDQFLIALQNRDR